jgi:hypothetical protein
MWLALLALAAVANACMDALWSRFSRSVFKNQDPKWWNPNVSWQYQPLYLGYRIDAWHLAKTGMVGFIALAIVLYKPLLGWYDVLLAGVVWNAVFELFYSKLLIRK